MTTTLAFTPPRVLLVQDAHSSAGAEAVDLARMAGLELDPWQAFVLEHSLAERPDGRWAAFEVGVNAPRQNGKGGIIEARELAGLFLLGERLITHTAHLADTSFEAFRRLELLIKETPELARRVASYSHSHGAEGIELVNGHRIRFRTRTKGGGRGFSGDCVILDEAMILSEASHGALMPTLSARPNPQLWYLGSAVDQEIHHDGVVWARIRERGLAGEDDSLAYFEWSADPGADSDGNPLGPSEVADDVSAGEDAWREANPALGVRITAEHVEKERRSMDPRTFAVERLGVGDWPDTDPGGASVIDIEEWRALCDPGSTMGDVVLAFDVRPDRGASAICAAGRRPDGLVHVEVVDHRRGTGWVADRMAELRERHKPTAVLCDSKGPAASLADDVGADAIGAAEYVKACGVLFDLVADARLRHLGTPDLDAAIRGAAKRPLVDAWAWSRKASRVDISPLVAATIAAWQVEQRPVAPSSWRPL